MRTGPPDRHRLARAAAAECGLHIDGALARVVVPAPLTGETVRSLHHAVDAALRAPVEVLELELCASGPLTGQGLAALVVTRRRLRAAQVVLVLVGVADESLLPLRRLGLTPTAPAPPTESRSRGTDHWKEIPW